MQPLSTSRLCLEPLNRTHAAEMFPLLSDAAIYRFLDYGPPASAHALEALYTRLEAGQSPDGREIWLNWLLRLPSGPALGYVQATVYPAQKRYVGYVLAPRHWRQGYASEAMTAMLAHLDALHPTPVTMAVVERENIASARLLLRLGFDRAEPSEAEREELSASECLYLRRSQARATSPP